MLRAVLAALAAAFLFSCTGYIPTPHPSPEHKIAACALSCPSSRGWFARFSHTCANGAMYLLDILITGEETDEQNPSEGRWLTGVTSVAVERIVVEHMRAEGIAPTDPDDRWSKRFAELFEAIRAEVGSDAVETYDKRDVILLPCSVVKQMRTQARDADQRGRHPGEPDPLHPNQ